MGPANRRCDKEMRQIIILFCGSVMIPKEVLAESFSELPDKILSQCGLVSALLVAAVIWLATQLAKTRAAWEADRIGMKTVIGDLNTSYNNLAVSQAKQEGILLSIRTGGNHNG